MAHDAKNPLAAIRGAAQFLQQERAEGRSIDEQAVFVDLIVEQTERLERVLQDYQRLGRAEAQRAPVGLRTLLTELAEAQRAASSAHTIEVEAAEDLAWSLDRDLVLGALENLVRNAREATPDGGRLVLRARRDGPRTLALEVDDDGPGMDVRTREQAFDDFFTTKATGSGLGLAFVGRVASAHGGTARVEALSPRGTRVVLTIAATEKEARERPSLHDA
jgi:signal transduction histidine kinase